MKNLRDVASNDIKKIKTDVRISKKEVKRKMNEVLISFTKNITKVLDDAAKDIAKIVRMSGKEMLRLAQNPDEVEEDVPDDIMCMIADVKTLLGTKMAAVRKITNLVSAPQEA